MIDILFIIFVVLNVIWCGAMILIIILTIIIEYYKTKKK